MRPDGDADGSPRRRATTKDGTVSRRALLGACAGTVAGAGCLTASGGTETNGTVADDAREEASSGAAANASADERASIDWPPLPSMVEDRPEGVYVPPYDAAFHVVDSAERGEYGCLLGLTRPVRYWTALGRRGCEANPIEPARRYDAMHLTVLVWDAETGRVLTEVGPRGALRSEDGSTKALPRTIRAEHPPPDRPLREPIRHTDGTEIIYPMIDQDVGFHYGSNIRLAQGSYRFEVEVGPIPTEETGRIDKPIQPVRSDGLCQGRTLGPLGVQRRGGFAGRFETAETFDFSLTFDFDAVASLPLHEPEGVGRPGPHEPLDDPRVPTMTAPAPRDLPGTLLGSQDRGGIRYVVTARPDEDRIVVSPRTRYSGFAVPRMTLAVVDGGEERVLHRAISPDAGHHYTARLDGDPTALDAVELRVLRPPHLARHEGYETAFNRKVSVAVPVTA